MTYIVFGVVLMAVGAGLILFALGAFAPRDPARPKPPPNMPVLGVGLLIDLAGVAAAIYGAMRLT